MKKILIISQGYWPEIFPINPVTKKLSEKDFKIDALTGYPNYPKGKFFSGFQPYKITVNKNNNTKIFRVPIISRGINSKTRIILNYFSFIISAIVFGGFVLRKKKYEIILVYATSPIFQAYIGVFFKFLKKAKLVTWVQDLWPNILRDTGIIKNKIILKIIKFFVAHIYNSNDLILSQSKSFRRDIKKLTNTKVSVMYNPGYSEKKILKNKFNKKINILYAGNIGNAQPWEMIINLLKLEEYKTINLTICGDGQKFNYIKNFIERNKTKNIILKGFVKGKKLEEQYKKNNYLLIMLKSGNDLNKTIPSKFQTYLFYKKPIIALSDGEVYELIKNFNLGFVSKPYNKKKINKMFDDIISLKEKKYKKIVKNTEKFYIKNFSQNTINEKLKNELYKI